MQLLCKKKKEMYLHSGVERRAGYVVSFQLALTLSDGDCVDLT